MPDMTPEETRKAAQALQDENTKLYSQYVAISNIYVNGALAYIPGHAVNALAVENGVVDKALVAKVGTKAAEAAPTPGPVVDPTATPVA
jgi:hypothetical protein